LAGKALTAAKKSNQVKTVYGTYLTFVGIDRNKKPTPIPRLSPETPDEVRRFENAKLRVAARQELLRKIRTRPDEGADSGG